MNRRLVVTADEARSRFGSCWSVINAEMGGYTMMAKLGATIASLGLGWKNAGDAKLVSAQLVSGRAARMVFTSNGNEHTVDWRGTAAEAAVDFLVPSVRPAAGIVIATAVVGRAQKQASIEIVSDSFELKVDGVDWSRPERIWPTDNEVFDWAFGTPIVSTATADDVHRLGELLEGLEQ